MVNDLDEDGCEFTVNARLAREAIKLFALGQALHLMGHALHLILDECVWRGMGECPWTMCVARHREACRPYCQAQSPLLRRTPEEFLTKKMH